MIKSGNDEERYIIYFKKFIAHQDSQKRGIVISDIELEDEFLPNIEQSNKYTSNNSRTKGTKSTASQIAALEQQVDTGNEESTLKSKGRCLNLKGELDDRVSKRAEILKELSSVSSAKNNKKYDELIENLIDLEESFVLEY